jgi:hypothetical protein
MHGPRTRWSVQTLKADVIRSFARHRALQGLHCHIGHGLVDAVP